MHGLGQDAQGNGSMKVSDIAPRMKSSLTSSVRHDEKPDPTSTNCLALLCLIMQASMMASLYEKFPFS